MNQRILPAWVAIFSVFIPSIGLATISSMELAVATSVEIGKAASREPFYSKAGRFSIDFPSEPAVANEKMSKELTIYSFIVAGKEGFYQVGYYDVATLRNFSRKEVGKLLDQLPSIYLKELQAKLVSTKNIQIENNLGKEFNFTAFGQIGKGRVYIVKDRIYSNSYRCSKINVFFSRFFSAAVIDRG